MDTMSLLGRAMLVAALLAASACADVPPELAGGAENNGVNNGGDGGNGGDDGNNDVNNTSNNGVNNDDGNNDDGNNDANNDGNNDANNDGNNDTGPPDDGCNPDAPEICDGFDNNCNDTVDEGCTCTAAEKSCYAGPPSTMGVGLCQAGVQECEVEFYGPCEGQILPGVEICDAQDNDCDGMIDEAFPELGTTCDAGGVGGCASQGLVICSPDGASTTCNAVEVEPGDELCDGLDNDCDDQIDEDFADLGSACEVGLGACLNAGVNICTEDGAGTICGVEPLAPREELCDGIDNNCNGQVDETFAGLGESCQEGVGACAANGTARCSDDGTELICDATPGQPQTEVCDGIDNDCNGQIDELPECDNQGPAITCPDEINANVLDTVTLTAIATDPDGDALTVGWTLDSAPIGSVSMPTPNNRRDTELFLDLAGDYTLTFTASDPFDHTASCTTVVRSIPSERLRVELIWNVGVNNDPSDVDLHLLRLGSGGTWFDRQWDCYYSNCNASGGDNLEWGAPGDADNPRLDLDDVQGNGPENINIDNPEAQTYRLGIHYYDDDDFGDSTVIVRIYCNAQLFREFEPVVLSAIGANNGSNDFWQVADIAWTGNTCNITEFGTPGNRDIRARSSF